MENLDNSTAANCNTELESQPETSSPLLFLVFVWVVKVAISGMISSYSGWIMVDKLRKLAYTTDKIWKLSLPIFGAPIALFAFSRFISYWGFIDVEVADSLTLGLVVGSLLKLQETPKGMSVVKLVVHQPNGRSVDVWLDSCDVNVGTARAKIADTLKILDANRVCIESGKGSFISDLSAQLFSIINADESNMSTDFFGFITASCNVHLKKEEEVVEGKIPDIDDGKKNFFLSRTQVKYGDLFFLNAKSIVAPSSDGFQVSAVDRFAAASPTKSSHQTQPVRWVHWDAVQNSIGSAEAVSEAGDGPSSSVVGDSTSGSTDNKSTATAAKSKNAGDGEPVRHGDFVILQCAGKYMSVNRGWWMGWSSNAPRRSGAFKVEIVEKASHHTLKEHMKEMMGQLKEKMTRPSIYSLSSSTGAGALGTIGSTAAGGAGAGGGPASGTVGVAGGGSVPTDDILRTGDTFRLRSVKFPEYELGITNEHIRDDYCYVGLRKAGDKDSDTWCLAVRFSVKAVNFLSNDIFKK